MDTLLEEAAPLCLVPEGRLRREDDPSYSVSTAWECGDREELRVGRRSLSKQVVRGKSWRKPDAGYGDEGEAKLSNTKGKGLLSKSPLKQVEKAKSRRKVAATRRKCHRRPPRRRWISGSASDEDEDRLSFRHRRPNASKFSKVGPNSCVFLPVPEDAFIEDMLSDTPHYSSNSQLKSTEYWSGVAAEPPLYRGPWRPRRYY